MSEVPLQGADDKDLMKTCAGEKTCQLLETQAPPSSRLSHGRRSKAVDQRLHIVIDRVRFEERLGQGGEHAELVCGVFLAVE